MQVAMLLSTEGASTLTFAADTDSTVNSMGTFASIKMGKFNQTVKQISRTLAKLLQAIKGFIFMSLFPATGMGPVPRGY
jgi:hypothetical protein